MRLEPSNFRSQFEETLFQFHKGAIRTPLLGDVSASGNVFQFHKGAIRTRSFKKMVFKRIISIP